MKTCLSLLFYLFWINQSTQYKMLWFVKSFLSLSFISLRPSFVLIRHLCLKWQLIFFMQTQCPNDNQKKKMSNAYKTLPFFNISIISVSYFFHLYKPKGVLWVKMLSRGSYKTSALFVWIYWLIFFHLNCVSLGH